ncbi:SOS response-associated peptidase [Hwanghaeella grinnelliae]|uniref:Abasic site processing protein n=1 Tax=Hwanghaeella grinnelliae TaxID=2500179 RepID=A0A437QHB5_9PROT|nr:SOS response-associated peptidase [Hwanghaeella grinnelliae]RVU33806.1 SOS response-associated peptidase [Hwanghaeella grinnelliae]
MCGRFSLTTPVEGIRRLFGFSQIPNLPARFNIAPTQAVLNVRASNPGQAGGAMPTSQGTDGVRDAFLARWGLIPSWAKDPAIGAKMINARAETITEKPAFRAAFRRRRCLIPADSFYEWKTIAGAKQAFRITFDDGEPFAFAALWEDWQGADGSELETCTIVTTDAIPAIEEIHHRMPVILDQEGFETWLTGSDEAAQKLLRPYAGPRRLMSGPISNRVNNVRNDGPELWDPVPLPEEGTAAATTNNDASGAADTAGSAKADKGQLSLF